MAELINIDLGGRSRRLRVDTLVTLRWLALLGQAIALVVTYFGLGFSLPFGPCLLVIAASAGLNLGLRLRFGRIERLEDVPAALILAYDILQLTALLYLTGGIENPFSVLYLAPIMISAVSLSGRITLILTLLMIGAVSALTFRHYPLPWFSGEQLQLPLIYNTGIWVAIVLGAAFIAIYASRVAVEARKLADALAATELVIAREQHLTQLDGLAAAAAHELGTPLATITLIVKDLQEQLPASDPLEEDLTLLAQETGRCRAILGKLASRFRSSHIYCRGWARAGTGLPAEPRDIVRARQSDRKRDRLRGFRSPYRGAMEWGAGWDSHRGQWPRFFSRCGWPDRRALRNNQERQAR
jgi:two-component system sensor histidine kinase RegB